MKPYGLLRLYILLISCCLLIVASIAISIQLFQNAKSSEADVTQLQVGVDIPSSTTLVGNIFLPGNSKWSSDGKLGIGTTGPNDILDVYGSARFGTSGNVVRFEAQSGFNRFAFNELRFYDWDGGGDMVTFSNGNVGIGTVSPGQKLEVNGYLKFTNSSTYGNTIGTSDGTLGNFNIGGAMGSNDYFSIFGDGASNAGILHIRTGDDGTEPIQFEQNTNVRMAINSGGNVDVAGSIDVTGGSGTAYNTAPIEIATTLTPRIAFHRPGVVASQIGMESNGWIRTYNNPGTGYENFAAATMTANGNVNITGGLYFTAANPTISASSYFIAAGGAYFSSGTVYTEATIQARGGIADDGGDLELNDYVRISGAVVCLGGYCPSNYAIRLTPNLHLNSNGGYATIVNWDNGTTGATQTFRVGNGAGADAFYVRADGYTQINGALYASGSSLRFKENISNLQIDTEKIYQLRPVSFDFKPEYESYGQDISGGRQMGLIAEEVYKVIPELAIREKDGNLVSNVDYEKLGVLLLKEVQKHEQTIDQLKKENAELRETVGNLEERIEKLESISN